MHQPPLPQGNIPSTHFCVAVSSSRVKISNQRTSCPKCVSCLPTQTTCAPYQSVPDLAFFAHILILRDETTTLSQKVETHLPSDMASYPRKTETLTVLLQSLKTRAFCSVFSVGQKKSLHFSPCLWYGYMCHLFVIVEVLIAVSINP